MEMTELIDLYARENGFYTNVFTVHKSMVNVIDELVARRVDGIINLTLLGEENGRDDPRIRTYQNSRKDYGFNLDARLLVKENMHKIITDTVLCDIGRSDDGTYDPNRIQDAGLLTPFQRSNRSRFSGLAPRHNRFIRSLETAGRGRQSFSGFRKACVRTAVSAQMRGHGCLSLSCRIRFCRLLSAVCSTIKRAPLTWPGFTKAPLYLYGERQSMPGKQVKPPSCSEK